VYIIEAAHNPEVAGSTPAPARGSVNRWCLVVAELLTDDLAEAEEHPVPRLRCRLRARLGLRGGAQPEPGTLSGSRTGQPSVG
jgi:hypothetical protein